MQPTAGFLRLALCLSSLSPLVSAWPEWLPPRDALIVRADDEASTTTAEETSASVTDEPTATETNEDDDEGESTVTKTSADKTATKTDAPKRTTYAANAPPGGVTMADPNTMVVPTPLYKIGDNVSMSWNYTSLRGKPTAIDVLLSCSYATATWTLTSNMTFETDVSFYWDTRDQENDAEQPLLTEMYTLVIKDSEADITDLPEPGYLGAYSGFTFGMYYPIEYTPYPKWKEQNNYGSAASGIDRTALGFALAMSIITFTSFTWFVTGLGLH
jgi:hypothetical protein